MSFLAKISWQSALISEFSTRWEVSSIWACLACQVLLEYTIHTPISWIRPPWTKFQGMPNLVMEITSDSASCFFSFRRSALAIKNHPMHIWGSIHRFMWYSKNCHSKNWLFRKLKFYVTPLKNLPRHFIRILTKIFQIAKNLYIYHPCTVCKFS